MASFKDYNNLTLPSPSKDPKFREDDLNRNYKEINAFFEDFIRDYPDKIQQSLKEIYYGENYPTRSLEGVEELTHLNILTGPKFNRFEIFINSKSLINIPLLHKYYLARIVASQVGPALERITQIGSKAFKKEIETFQNFIKFTPTILDYSFYKNISPNVLNEEFKNNPHQNEFGETLLKKELDKIDSMKDSKYITSIHDIINSIQPQMDAVTFLKRVDLRNLFKTEESDFDLKAREIGISLVNDQNHKLKEQAITKALKNMQGESEKETPQEEIIKEEKKQTVSLFNALRVKGRV